MYQVDEHMYSTIMGSGPAITIMDGSSISNKKLVDMLKALGDAKVYPIN